MKHKHGRKSWGKRGITIFLTLSLMVSLLSTAVFAEGDTEDTDCDHDWEDWVTVLSNCEEKVEERQCTLCEEWDTKTTELGGTHEWSESYEYSDDCYTYTARKCTKCEEEDSVVTETHHLLVNWTVIEEAECGALKSYKCDTCGAFENEYFPNDDYTGDNHSWGEWITQYENCEEKYEWRQCKVCGKEEGNYTQLDGTHEWYNPVESSTVCETFVTYDCKYCDAQYTETTRSEHHFVDAGFDTYVCDTYAVSKCTVCGQTDSEWYEANHQFGDWTVVEEAECGTSKSRQCKICGDSEEEYYPNESYTGDDHNWGEWITLYKNCEETAKERQCKACGERESEITKLDGTHVWGEWIIEEEQCYTDMTHYCDICGVAYGGRTITGEHTWGDWTVVEEAECGARKVHTCTVCGNGEEEVFKNEYYTGNDHPWGEWELGWIDCEEKYELRQCTVCNEFDYKYTKLDGTHNWSAWEEVDATQCENSYKIRTCQNEGCDVCQVDKTDKEIVHHTAGKINIATCIWEDYYEYNTICTICGEFYFCDENGNQMFDEDGDEYWPDSECGYNPNNHAGGTKLVNAVAATDTTNGYTGDLYCLGCDELITKGEVIPATGNKTATGDVYEILNGAASVWTPETKTGLVIRSNADISKFVQVLINGVVLDKQYYTVTEGSTIITISEEYLSTLKDGEYTIEIVSTDGSATTTFSVEGNDAKADIKDDTKKEEPVTNTETKKEEPVVNTDTKKDEATASTTKKDTTKADTKSDTASSGAKTGDESNLVLWVSSLGISFAALALLAVMNKKRYTGKRVK
jgi:hypothetical protein